MKIKHIYRRYKHKQGGEMNEMNAFKVLGHIEKAHIIQFPSGRWGFVGCVPDELAFIGKDGSEPTQNQIKTAKQFGIGFSELKTRAFDSEKTAKATFVDWQLKQSNNNQIRK